MANTSAPLSEVAVCNMAATTLDETRITSLDDDTVLGRFMASQYGYARDEYLRSHPWAFAKRRAVLSPLGDKPAFGWDYQYQLPTNCLRLMPLRRGGYFEGAMPKFEREGSMILTNEGPVLPIHFIARVTNASEFEVLFARALGERLALLAAQRITGKGSYVEKALALYRAADAEAKAINALDYGSVEGQYRQDVLDVRMAG